MKSLKAMFAFGFAVIALSACGSSNSAAPATTVANSCAVGMTLNPQFNSCCPAGQPSYSNVGCVAATPIYNNGYGSACAAGQVNSQYGCISQGACPAGYGMYNNSCVVATASNTYGTTCAAGQVNSQYGCIAQGACPTGYGMYNNSCILATNAINNNTGLNNPSMNGSCAPGSFSTQMGCMPQGPCQYGQVFYNNQCYYLQNSYNTGFQFYFHW